jgi:hypothetical protein
MSGIVTGRRIVPMSGIATVEGQDDE